MKPCETHGCSGKAKDNSRIGLCQPCARFRIKKRRPPKTREERLEWQAELLSQKDPWNQRGAPEDPWAKNHAPESEEEKAQWLAEIARRKAHLEEQRPGLPRERARPAPLPWFKRFQP